MGPDVLKVSVEEIQNPARLSLSRDQWPRGRRLSIAAAVMMALSSPCLPFGLMPTRMARWGDFLDRGHRSGWTYTPPKPRTPHVAFDCEMNQIAIPESCLVDRRWLTPIPSIWIDCEGKEPIRLSPYAICADGPELVQSGGKVYHALLPVTATKGTEKSEVEKK